MKKKIEVGNGLPDLETTQVIVDALKEAGFEVLEAYLVFLLFLLLLLRSVDMTWHQRVISHSTTPWLLDFLLLASFTQELDDGLLEGIHSYHFHSFLLDIDSQLKNGEDFGVYQACPS